MQQLVVAYKLRGSHAEGVDIEMDWMLEADHPLSAELRNKPLGGSPILRTGIDSDEGRRGKFHMVGRNGQSGPTVSIIIVNWNRKDLLADCLQSLNRQAFRDFETIVVDNGSYDESADYVRSAFKETQLIELEKKCGFCSRE